MTNDLPKVGDPKPGVKDPSSEWPFYTRDDIDKLKKSAAEQQADAKDAARYRWLANHPQWIASYRERRLSGKEWRMRCEGDWWGVWWPTHQQAVDAAMKGTP
jgi:hypothetical protein